MSVEKTTGEPSPNREEIIKKQINNIDIVGKILVEESGIIKQFMESKTIIENPNSEDFKKNLKNIAVALGVAAQYFEGKVKGLENELKKITDK